MASVVMDPNLYWNPLVFDGSEFKYDLDTGVKRIRTDFRILVHIKRIKTHTLWNTYLVILVDSSSMVHPGPLREPPVHVHPRC
jgi:hypothetical protein